jgi:hypothetical protein
VLAGALHEDRHLIRHKSHVGLGLGEDGKAGPLASRRHEKEARAHLDDGLPDLATAEVPASAAC